MNNGLWWRGRGSVRRAVLADRNRLFSNINYIDPSPPHHHRFRHPTTPITRLTSAVAATSTMTPSSRSANVKIIIIIYLNVYSFHRYLAYAPTCGMNIYYNILYVRSRAFIAMCNIICIQSVLRECSQFPPSHF